MILNHINKYNIKSNPKDYVCDPLYFKPNNHSAHKINHNKRIIPSLPM